MVASVNNLSNLAEEARAFDNQIRERAANGHIPDLRNSGDCDYFYNNVWRRKYLVDLDLVEQFKLIEDAIQRHSQQNTPSTIRVLEIGCGPGHTCLELARSGYQVVGVDISETCIEIAQQTADAFPIPNVSKNLSYHCLDIFNEDNLKIRNFDVVLFVGALHHFGDQLSVHNKCNSLLKDDGIFICHEPVRDLVTKQTAELHFLIEQILVHTGSFYIRDKHAIGRGQEELKNAIENKFSLLRYEGEEGDKLQSINDNEAGYAEMRPFLDSQYVELEFQWRYSFFHEIAGGLRLSSETANKELALFLREMDKVMVKTGAIEPNEFFFVGRKIS
jgi:2-polyprenyl-6-hydroxyphenyl methylase/3-demethylubiquinone-9 3-methyltransferase